MRPGPLLKAYLFGAVKAASFIFSLYLLLPSGQPKTLNSSEWSKPADVASPYTDGQDLSGTLLCDSGQNLHILWGKSHASASEVYYLNDVAGVLSQPIDVLASSDSFAVRLSAVIAPTSNTLHLVWQNDWTAGDLLYSRAPLTRAGDARSWSNPTLLLSAIDGGQILVDNSGHLQLFYVVSGEGGYQNTVYQMSSFDDGGTWTAPRVIYESTPPFPGYASVGVDFDEAGRIHLGITTRSTAYGEYSELGYLRSPDGGENWDPYRLVAEQNEQTPNVSVLAPYTFGADEVHLTWHDPRRMHMWSLDGGETWHEPVEIMTLGAGFGGANGLVKDSAGTLYAVSGVQNGVYVARWSGSEWESPVQVEDREMDPHGQRIVVCQGNQLHVLYDDRVEEDTTVWYTHRTVDAPHIPQEPLPAEELPVDNVEGVSVLGGVGQPTAVPSVAASPPPVNISPLPPRQSTTIRLLLPVAVTNILIIGAMVTRRLRGS